MVFGGVVFFFPFLSFFGVWRAFLCSGGAWLREEWRESGGGLLFSQFRRIIPHWDGCWCTYYYYLFLAATQGCRQQEVGRVLCIEREREGEIHFIVIPSAVFGVVLLVNWSTTLGL